MARYPKLIERRYTSPSPKAFAGTAKIFCESAGSEAIDLSLQRENSSRLHEGVFRFLNRERRLGIPVDWDPAEATRLWRYNLHYFDYALDLAILAKWDGQRHAAELLGRLFFDWIGQNPVGKGVGWHSYPIARRLVNWIQAFALVGPELLFGSAGDETWLKSLYAQTRYLEDHLEVDVLGNHLLANGKALLFAGVFFGDEAGSRWQKLGEDILWHGLEDQILADGGHEERSPMYHAIVLQDYLEVLLIHKLNGIEVPDWVGDRLALMADFLDGLRHPDGEIPLFGDAAFGIAHSPGDILAAAERLLGQCGRWNTQKAGLYGTLVAPVTSGNHPEWVHHKTTNAWAATGYVKLCGSRAGDRMIIDAKPMGPQHLPAHGHCSLFSYELSLAGRRMVVDSGVEEYERGAWRDYWRSTRAHNTVTVDGAEQTEVWASFRAGQRTRVLESSFFEGKSGSLFVGKHIGFAGQNPPTPHQRIIAYLRGGYWVIFDQVEGDGTHSVQSFVHLHPGAECIIRERYIDIVSEQVKLRLHPYLQRGLDPIQMTVIRGDRDPIQGWYAPEFGKCESNSVVRLSVIGELPVCFGYLLAPQEANVEFWDLMCSDMQDNTKNILISIKSSSGDVRERFEVRI